MAIIKPHAAEEDEPMVVDDVSDEEDDDLRSESDGEGLLLGFLQDVPECANGVNLLDRFHFPSKVGGSPAWLDPVHLPAKAASLCGICSKPLTFLLQVYAPVDTVESAFHRTVFLFACADGACWRRQRERGGPAICAAVFRCQMSRSNSFYSYDPPREDGLVDTSRSAGQDATPCSWCRTWRGDLSCGRCKRQAYCSKAHQVAHWKAGHSKQCTAPSDASTPSPGAQAEASLSSSSHPVRQDGGAVPATASSAPGSAPMDTDTPMEESRPVGAAAGAEPGGRAAGAAAATDGAAPPGGFLLREYELAVEAIEDVERDYAEREGGDGAGGAGADGGGAGEGRQQRLLREYEARRAAMGAEGDYSAAELAQVKASREESHWASVQAELDKAPGQVLRYSRLEGSHPLWMKESERPPEPIPRCAHCGGERVFEFQVLPQLLFYLKVDNGGAPAPAQDPASSAAGSSFCSMDWGTIIVYTCKDTCQPESEDASASAYVQEYVWAQSAVA